MIYPLSCAPQINFKTVPCNRQSLIFNRNNWKGTRGSFRALSEPLQEHHFLNQVSKRATWEIGCKQCNFSGEQVHAGVVERGLCSLQKKVDTKNVLPSQVQLLTSAIVGLQSLQKSTNALLVGIPAASYRDNITYPARSAVHPRCPVGQCQLPRHQT